VYKSLVYIEKSILNDNVTKSVVDKINAKDIVLIDHYKKVLNQTNSHWLFNKKYQKIILAKRENEFYYKGSYLTSSLGYQHFYYNTLALNCVFHCEYCYLQGMYNTPHLVLFLNNHDFIEATKSLIKQLNDTIYLALSYDTDLLALEHYYPYCEEWINFAHEEKKLHIEIRTKSHQVDRLDRVQPLDNVLLSFTLSPDIIQKRYEPFTPTLEQRINAVKKVIQKGFRVMLCFDPIIYVPDFECIYKDFFNKVFSEIQPNSIDSVSIGVFRMNNDFFKRIRKNGNISDLYFYLYQVKNNVVTYSEDIKKEMLLFVSNELNKRKITRIHICE
jgi:spore photoproduct lyase